MQKLPSIQGLRAIAALLVVLSHLAIVEKKYSAFTLIPYTSSLTGISGVDIFFVISGFIMLTISRHSIHSTQDLKRFFYNRLTRIYPVYWFYAIPVALLLFLQPSLINHNDTGSLVASFLLLPQPADKLPLIATSWTLTYEIWFYLIFALVMGISNTFFWRQLMIWVGLLLIAQIIALPSSPYLELISNPLALEFIAGVFIASWYNHRLVGNKYLYVSLFLLAIIALFIGNRLSIAYQYTVPMGFSRVLLFGIPAAISVYALTQAERCGFNTPKWLVAIGNASYSIYLSHVLIISALGRMVFALATNVVTESLVLIFLLGATIGFGLLSYHLVEKPLLQWFRRPRIVLAY